MSDSDGWFGLCPVCHKTDGYANTGRTHVFFCKEHKKRWCVGSNLFSSWRYETEAEQYARWVELGLSGFEDISSEYHNPNSPWTEPSARFDEATTSSKEPNPRPHRRQRAQRAKSKKA